MHCTLQSHSAGHLIPAVHRRQQCLCPAFNQHPAGSRTAQQACRASSSTNLAAATALAAALLLPGAAYAADVQQQQQQQQLCPAPHVAEQQQQSQQQRPHARQRVFESRSIAELAGLFDASGDEDPFTLYGTNFKKYQIENIVGEKVVSRQRGFTVDSCVSAIAANEETPEINGLSTREKVQAGDGLLCKRAVGPDLKQACKQSCTSACSEALAAYEERLFAASGYRLEPKIRERVLKQCRHACAYECTKSGTAHDFVVTSRR